MPQFELIKAEEGEMVVDEPVEEGAGVPDLLRSLRLLGLLGLLGFSLLL